MQVSSTKILPLMQTARRSTIAMQIYSHLRQQIVTGLVQPLQRLSESEIAASLGASRTPVREAFGKLEEEGLIAILPQYGTFVAPIRHTLVASSQFVREALECTAIREATLRCTEAEADALEALLAAQHSTRSDAEFLELDDRLHQTLMAMAGQAAAWGVVHSAKATIDRIRYLSARRQTKRQTTIEEHQRIVVCVTARDAEGAVAAMREHLRGVFASTERSMQLHPEYFQTQPGDWHPMRKGC